jgi:hypothetical protein
MLADQVAYLVLGLISALTCMFYLIHQYRSGRSFNNKFSKCVLLMQTGLMLTCFINSAVPTSQVNWLFSLLLAIGISLMLVPYVFFLYFRNQSIVIGSQGGRDYIWYSVLAMATCFAAYTVLSPFMILYPSLQGLSLSLIGVGGFIMIVIDVFYTWKFGRRIGELKQSLGMDQQNNSELIIVQFGLAAVCNNLLAFTMFIVSVLVPPNVTPIINVITTALIMCTMLLLVDMKIRLADRDGSTHQTSSVNRKSPNTNQAATTFPSSRTAASGFEDPASGLDSPPLPKQETA